MLSALYIYAGIYFLIFTLLNYNISIHVYYVISGLLQYTVHALPPLVIFLLHSIIATRLYCEKTLVYSALFLWVCCKSILY